MGMIKKLFGLKEDIRTPNQEDVIPVRCTVNRHFNFFFRYRDEWLIGRWYIKDVNQNQTNEEEPS